MEPQTKRNAMKTTTKHCGSNTKSKRIREGGVGKAGHKAGPNGQLLMRCGIFGTVRGPSYS